MIVITQGSMFLRTGKVERQGVVGSVFIRPPGTVHEEICTSSAPIKSHVVFFDVPRRPKELPFPLEAFDATGRVRHALTWLEEIKTNTKRGPLNNLLELALLECGRPARPAESTWLPGVLAHIRNNLPEPLTVGALARLAGMSEGHFSREFHLQTGLSPMACVRRERIDQACRAISQTNTLLREVARQTGFRDEFELSRVFRRVMGVAPGALRMKEARRARGQQSSLDRS